MCVSTVKTLHISTIRNVPTIASANSFHLILFMVVGSMFKKVLNLHSLLLQHELGLLHECRVETYAHSTVIADPYVPWDKE